MYILDAFYKKKFLTVISIDFFFSLIYYCKINTFGLLSYNDFLQREINY